MNLCRCENGHFYDKEKYATCPHCTGGSAEDNSLTSAFTMDVTSAVTQSNMQNSLFGKEGETEKYEASDSFPVSDRYADEPTEAIYSTSHADSQTIPMTFTQTVPMDEDEDHTVGIYDDFFASPVSPTPGAFGVGQKNLNKTPQVNKVSTPCVGWLIAISGAHIGTDFRLKVGKNFVGRGSQMDVALTEDKSVSRDKHAIVVYEPKAHLYLVQPGESSSLVYKNDEVVLTPVKLEAYDVITVGDVNLLFMPLCGKRFNWGDLFDKMKNK